MKQPTKKQKRLIETILTQRYRIESPVEYGRIPPNDKWAGEMIIAGLDLRVREYPELTLVKPH